MEYRCTDKVSVDDPVEKVLTVPLGIYPWTCLGTLPFPDPKTATVR